MGEIISFQSNGGTAEGYLARSASGKGPGVIVIQEWWGLNDQIKGVADRFASEGFTALAPDFYHGKGAEIGEPDEAGKLMMALNIKQVAKDGRGAAAFLGKETGEKVGVIGFCMGGQLALLVGTVAPDEVGAVVDMYGVHPAVTPDFTKLSGPVLALFGDHDDWNDAPARESIKKQLEQAGVRYELDVYEGAGHGFMNEQRPEAYNKEAAEDSWRRAIAFFREHLSS